MGREVSKNFKRYFKKTLYFQNGRRIILNYLPIIMFQYLKCSINKNIVLLFERHKLNPRPNTKRYNYDLCQAF